MVDRKKKPQFEVGNRYAVLQVQTEEDNQKESSFIDLSLAQTLFDKDKVRSPSHRFFVCFD